MKRSRDYEMDLLEGAVQRLMKRNTILERLVVELRDARAQELDLLNYALHELAGALGKEDRRRYARSWITNKREEWARADALPRKEERSDTA